MSGRAVIAGLRCRPLTLTWRTGARSAVRRIGRPATVIIRCGWSPRFHLHINLAFAARWSKRTNVSPVYAPPAWRRHVFAHLPSIGANVRSFLSRETRRLVRRTLHGTAVHERSVRRSTYVAVQQIFRVREAPSRKILSGGLLRAPALEKRRAGANPIRHTTFRIQHSLAELQTRHRLMRFISDSQVDRVFARGRAQSTQALFRPPELVWRTEAQPLSLDLIERGISAATSPDAPFGAGAHSNFEQWPAPVGSPSARLLDRALIDRVADDVIGRVERRIRIERERRGA